MDLNKGCKRRKQGDVIHSVCVQSQLLCYKSFDGFEELAQNISRQHTVTQPVQAARQIEMNQKAEQAPARQKQQGLGNGSLLPKDVCVQPQPIHTSPHLLHVTLMMPLTDLPYFHQLSSAVLLMSQMHLPCCNILCLNFVLWTDFV